MSGVIETLSHLGIDKKQVSIYLACLELGTATVQELADKSGIKRTSIYNFLDDMKRDGLISEVKQDGKILLVPENPNILVERSKKHVQKVEEMLPELMSIFNLPGNKPKVNYFEGQKGLRRAWDDMLESKETIYGFSDYEKMFGSFTEEFLFEIPKIRVESKQFFNCIAKDGPKGRMVKSKDKEHMRETRLIKDLEFDTEINIYGNKILLLSFRKPYASVLVEDRAIATTMKSIWKLVWNGLK